MVVKSINLVYFSPGGTVATTLRAIAEGTGLPSREFDLTSFASRWALHSFGSEDLVVVGMPVYGGRVPENAVEFFRCLRGNNSPTIFVTLYGNRAYEDALRELVDLGAERCLAPVAAGAFIGQHSCIDGLALGRPDAEDLRTARDFGASVLRRLLDLGSLEELSPIKLVGEGPYKARRVSTLVPTTDGTCTRCGICVEGCPAGAINPDDPGDIDKWRCMLCFRCVSICPERAKSVKNPALVQRFASIRASAGAVRKDPEIFL